MNGSETIGVIGQLENLAPMGYTILGVGLGFCLTWFRDKWVQRSLRKTYLFPMLKSTDGEMIQRQEHYDKSSDLHTKAEETLHSALDFYSAAPTLQNIRTLIRGLTVLTDVGNTHTEVALHRASTSARYQQLIDEIKRAGGTQKHINSLNLQYPGRPQG